MSKKNLGSSIDNFLKKEGIFEDAQTQTIVPKCVRFMVQ